jgi:hypothetical protein
MTAPFLHQQETKMKLLKIAAIVALAIIAERWYNLNPFQRAYHTYQLKQIMDDLSAIARMSLHDDPYLKALGINVALPPKKTGAWK